MKFHPALLALVATQSTAFAADAKTPVQMPDMCTTMVKAALAAINSGGLLPDDRTGDVTIDKDSLAAETIKNVRVIHTACLGPDDCDAQNPDAFTYAATLNKTGKVVVSYHRGNCSISKFSIN